MIHIKLPIKDWIFEVDIEQNMSFSTAQAQEHCNCGYCRNFYKTLDSTYPQVRPFLVQFGIDAEGPDELCPFEPTIYEASYIIHGRILKKGSPFLIHDIPVKVIASAIADMDTERPAPYFVLIIGLMELPWILPEDPREVISPANEEGFLKRMHTKLLSRLSDEAIHS